MSTAVFKHDANEEMQVWIEHVWSSLRDIPVGNLVDSFEAAWREHLNQPQPVAVIFGAYDSGKSSLLKRLLFEDACNVPPELTVSARRETFTVENYQGLDWLYRDSPGLAGGNEEHDAKALGSLDLAELLVWVLPPQLVTGARETFRKIASGEYFGVESAHLAGSLVIVLSRMDEAGIDPTDNASGFQDLCCLKESELSSLLASFGAEQPAWGVHPVCADPYQAVSNGEPDATVYAMGAGWDGISELRKALEDAAKRSGVLRTLAGYRFANRAVKSLSNAIDAELRRQQALRNTCQNELDRILHWRSCIAALRGKCAADLRRHIEDELLNASRKGIESSSESLHRGMTETVEHWCEFAYGEFQKLAASADQESAERTQSPSMGQLRRLVEEICEEQKEPEKATGRVPVAKYASSIEKIVREGLKGYAQLKLGMSLESASQRLKPVLESGATYSDYCAEHGKIFDNDHFGEMASRYVKANNAISAVGPTVAQLWELGEGVSDELFSSIEANKRREDREEIRNQLRNVAADVEVDLIQWFDKMTQSFSDWLEQQSQAQIPLQQALENEIEVMQGYHGQLKALIEQRPNS